MPDGQAARDNLPCCSAPGGIRLGSCTLRQRHSQAGHLHCSLGDVLCPPRLSSVAAENKELQVQNRDLQHRLVDAALPTDEANGKCGQQVGK